MASRIKNYKKYISEIKRFEMGLTKNMPPEELQTIMNYALAEFAIMPLSEINQELTVIKQMAEAFSELDTDYAAFFRKFKNGNFAIRELIFRLRPLFGSVRLDPEVITTKFMVGLYVSILNKQNSILAFRRKIQKLLATRSLLQAAGNL